MNEMDNDQMLFISPPSLSHANVCVDALHTLNVKKPPSPHAKENVRFASRFVEP